MIEYEPQYTIEGGWKRLVLCEQEWLARPDRWGIELLPERIRERKQRLYTAHFFRAFLDLVSWPFSQQIKSVLLEDDFVPAIDSWGAISQIQSSFATNVSAEVGELFRCLRIYCRGFLSAYEMWNKVYECMLHANTGERDWYSWARKHLDPITRRLAFDIVGNPYRPVAPDPRWLTSSVVDLAVAIYDERAWDRMPILADALMEAGCDHEEIMAHCRNDGLHVRGGWVVDLLLQKE